MNKHLELSTPTSCLNKARPDEPIFVLRAKDPKAAQTVRLWAAAANFDHEPEKIDEALRLADEMDKWHEANVPKAVATGYYEGDGRGQGMNSLISRGSNEATRVRVQTRERGEHAPF